jgi:hypothetical protein
MMLSQEVKPDINVFRPRTNLLIHTKIAPALSPE